MKKHTFPIFKTAFVLTAVLAVFAGCKNQPTGNDIANAGPWTVLFDSSGGGTAPASLTWNGGAGLTLPGVETMAKTGLVFGGWAKESAAGSPAASPFIPTCDTTLYARWLDVQSIVDEALARIAACPQVLGNPQDNPPAMLALSVLASELTVLLQGTDAERDVVTDGGTVRETYKVYDYPAIYEKSAALEEAAANMPEGAEIIVASKFFQYIAPTGSAPNPVQTATLRTAGVYEIELAGAAGGHIITNNGNTGPGGKGGHIKGEYNFSGDTDIAVRVGGAGVGTATINEQNQYVAAPDTLKDNPGGYNGGGMGGGGGTDALAVAAGSGGGATDVQLQSVPRNLTGVPATDSRIAVAGGGGGAASKGWNNSANGGNAGGMAGAEGDSNASKPQGGTQSSGGTQPTANFTAGSPGQGANGKSKKGQSGGNHSEGRGGGGGGWWGGGALSADDGNMCAGAGGSSYTGGAGVVTPVGSPLNETIQGNVWGDGWAKITWKR
jgi:hypothetical protein